MSNTNYQTLIQLDNIINVMCYVAFMIHFEVMFVGWNFIYYIHTYINEIGSNSCKESNEIG